MATTTSSKNGNYDLTVIGGGINGVAVAAEAAARGLKTLLVHARDLASGASASPVCLAGVNLQHLSALDYFQLSALLEELQLLHKLAPHLLDLLPVQKLNGDKANSYNKRLVDRIFKSIRNKSLSAPLQEKFRGFNMAARIKPARLIVCKALQAQGYGADIRTYHKVTEAQRGDSEWTLTISPVNQQKNETVTSRFVINCSGWAANNVLEDLLKVENRAKATQELRTQFFFRNTLKTEPEKRKVFKIQGQNLAFYIFHATNDILSFGPVKCDQDGYLECIDLQEEFLNAWNNAEGLADYAAPINATDILYKRRGKFGIIQDPCSDDDAPLAAPLLDLNNPGKAAVLLNIFGSDPSLAAKTARQAMDVMEPFTQKKANTKLTNEPLPGGDIQAGNMQDFIVKLQSEFNELPPKLINRLARNYGSLARLILGKSKTIEDLGEDFGNYLYEREIEYLVKMEWATCAEDILERRTFVHLSANKKDVQALQRWFEARYTIT